MLAYVGSMCFTFSKKAFKNVYFLGNFTTEVSQDKRLKKSETNFVYFG